MLSIVLMAYLIYVLFKHNSLNQKRGMLLQASIIFSVFFFSSADPFLGLPLYIFPLMLSIVFSFAKLRKLDRNIIMLFSLLFLCMLLPIIRIASGMTNDRFLIINQSITDVIDTNSQLMVPQFGKTIIKHFLFFLIYIVFFIGNRDLIINISIEEEIIKKIYCLFKVLFVGIILEWIVVNLLHGFNDRTIMQNIFSIKDLNQSTNWKTWGSYSVCFWLNERSGYCMVVLFYMIILKKRNIEKMDYFWLILSALAVYCTGSTSALVCFSIFIIAESIIILLKKRNINQIIMFTLLIIISMSVLIANYTFLNSKLADFISDKESWTSAFFRARSIEYGIYAIKRYPLFGVGIGTVYAHSLLIQTLANIGLVGIGLTLLLHYKICPIYMDLYNINVIFLIIACTYGAYMVQNFTSPLLLLIFIILNWSGKLSNADRNSKNYSLLLVRKN